jgi:long-chain acyl-CoA synthetase
MSQAAHPPTLADLLRRHAEATPTRPAIICGDKKLRYAELAESVLRLAGGLSQLGLAKGERLAVFSHKTPAAITAFLAAAAAGGVFFPLDANQPQAVTHDILTRLTPTILCVAAEFLPLIETMYPGGPPFTLVVMDGPSPSGLPTLTELAAGPFPAAPLPRVATEDPVYVNFTSGTTGAPKGAITTLGNLLANTVGAVDALGLTADDVHLCMMPVFVHPHETIMRPLYLGGAMVLCDMIGARSVAESCHKHKVTALMAVAAIYETLLRLPAMSDNPLDGLRVAESGGMHVPTALADGLSARYGVNILPVWGSTETTGVALVMRPGEAYASCCLGRPVPGYDVRVEREDGEETANGEPGELVVSGPGVCPGYFGQITQPEYRLHDSRFRTGDIVVRESDGRFYFAGRQSMLLKVGGMKVFPVEIEEALRTHPGVAEVIVIPMADALRGEVAKAVVVPKPGTTLDALHLRHHLSGRLHRLKMPRIIEIRDTLPRTPGGKIAWRTLLSQ